MTRPAVERRRPRGRPGLRRRARPRRSEAQSSQPPHSPHPHGARAPSTSHHQPRESRRPPRPRQAPARARDCATASSIPAPHVAARVARPDPASPSAAPTEPVARPASRHCAARSTIPDRSPGDAARPASVPAPTFQRRPAGSASALSQPHSLPARPASATHPSRAAAQRTPPRGSAATLQIADPLVAIQLEAAFDGIGDTVRQPTQDPLRGSVGARCDLALNTAQVSSPSNGLRAQVNSYKMDPSAKMSVRFVDVFGIADLFWRHVRGRAHRGPASPFAAVVRATVTA